MRERKRERESKRKEAVTQSVTIKASTLDKLLTLTVAVDVVQ